MPFLGMPTAWGFAWGLTGTGISIGIIDTGIDYIHLDFGGSGTSADYAANDTTSLADGLFPTAKVVGGYDFAGDDYDSAPNPVPQPDPDPMGCHGHGTHVAGTTAGYGVTVGDETYSGPWQQGMDFDQLKIGSGAAPNADLYALRVFSCSGSTELVTEALDWAVDPDGDGDPSDHLDIVNLSLGSKYGRPDDPDSVAVDNAVLAGIAVVASAGNAGDAFFITGSPACADRVLSVAASDDGGARPGVLVEEPASIAGHRYRATTAEFGPELTDAGLEGSVVQALNGTRTDACTTVTNGSELSGHIALVDRGGCYFSTKALNVQAAGAVAMIVVNTDDSLIRMACGGDCSGVTIPLVMIRHTDGEEIKAELPSPGVTVNVGARNFTDATLTDTLASFSSRGPRFGDALAKPDLTAPGVTVSFPGGTSISVPAATSAVFTVRLSADPAAMRHVRADDVDESQSGYDWLRRFYLTMEAGNVTLSSARATTLRVPLLAAPRPVSSMAAAESTLTLGGSSGTLNLHLTGTDLDSGSATPPDIRSQVSIYELGEISPRLLAPPATGGFDMAAVGVTSDYDAKVAAGGGLDDTTILFGITLHEPLVSPNPEIVEYDIYFDVDDDDVDDYKCWTQDIQVSDPTDAIWIECWSFVDDDWANPAWQGYLFAQGGDDCDLVAFGTRAVVIPVYPSTLSLSIGDTFRYRVETRNVDSDRVVDATGWHGYDPTQAGFVTIPAGSEFPPKYTADLDGTTVTIPYDRSRLSATGIGGLLLLHHHNPNAEQVQIVRTQFSTSCDADAGGATSTSDLPVTVKEIFGTPSPGGGDCGGDGLVNAVDLAEIIGLL